MANTASRLSANGSLTISGYFDEVSRPFSDNGLVSHWDGRRSFYIGQGTDDTWYDIKANNNIKLYYGANYTPGNVNFYLANASYGLVTIPQVATSSFVTIEGVIKSPISGGMFFGFGAYDVYTSGSNLGYNTAQSNVYGISSAQITSLGITNKYTHYAFVMVGLGGDIPTSNEIWINGVKQTLSNVVGTTTTNARGFNYYGDYGFLLNGWAISGSYRDYKNDISFANLRIYNRKLDANEIVQNYNLVAPNFGLTQISAPLVTKTTANNIIINGEYDEVTYNPIANVAINLFNYTQDFSNAYWNNRLTITSPNALAPDNTYTATLFTYNLEYAFIQNSTNFNITNTFGKTYTFSCYVKASTTNIALVTNTAYINYNVSNGTIGSYSGGTPKITKEANGFYRCSVTFTSTSTTENFSIWLAGYTGGVFTGQTITIWGPQVEVNSVVTPYQAKGASGLLQSNTAMKTTNTGNTFIKGSYDEYSKMSPITEGLIFNVDPGYEGSYIGSGAAMYDTTSNRYKVDLNSSPPYSSDFGGVLKFTSTFGNNAWANTNIPTRTITPTSNYTMSAWVKFNPSIKGLAEFQYYISATGSLVSPQANTGFAYGSAGTILGTNYYGDYGLFWYSQIRSSGEKQLLVGFQNRVTPYAEASPQLAYTMNNSLIFFNWTHIVGVLNNAGNFAGFYVNGVLVNSTTASQIASGSFPYSISTVRICADNVAGGSALGRNFDGDIGPMSIWNRALSTTEIQQMYTSQRSRFGV